jgi:hypothetical protein
MVVYQPRCIYCKREHYALNVTALSHGHAACHNCRRTPPVFDTVAAYRAALRDSNYGSVVRDAKEEAS